MADEAILRSIDAKLSALLAIVTDQHLRETGIAKPRPRSIDRLLTDAGLTPQQIGKLLGKTDRAVQKLLHEEATRAASEAVGEAGSRGRVDGHG
jgi:hypothetical protein